MYLVCGYEYTTFIKHLKCELAYEKQSQHRDKTGKYTFFHSSIKRRSITKLGTIAQELHDWTKKENIYTRVSYPKRNHKSGEEKKSPGRPEQAVAKDF